jgi:hypothetical protein
MKLPSRKSVTLLCGASDSTSRRRRTKTSAKLIHRTLWLRLLSAIANNRNPLVPYLPTSLLFFPISSLAYALLPPCLLSPKYVLLF